MPKLALIETEAARLVGRVPEARRRNLQQALLDLCDAHWLEMRGPEPATPLAHALWSVAPPRADLLADLIAAGDGRVDALLQGLNAAQAFALLAQAEIEHGNEEGVRLAHDPMMLFDSPAAGARYAEGVAAALRGARAATYGHPHDSKPALWKALARIAAHTGRYDLAGVTRVIGVLASQPAADAAIDAELEALRRTLDTTGVYFLGVDDDHVHFTLHGHAQPPVSTRQLGVMLGELRQTGRG